MLVCFTVTVLMVWWLGPCAGSNLNHAVLKTLKMVCTAQRMTHKQKSAYFCRAFGTRP